MRRMHHVIVAVSAAAVAACGSGTVQTGDANSMAGKPINGASEYAASVERDVARVRAATRAFKSVDAAASAGYAPSARQCIDNPPEGAMGYHHPNGALYDDHLEVERPEMLVYERTADGEYVLNGIEYIVPYSARSRDAEPPSIMGQDLKRADGLQLWYLHVWIWKENGKGLFADWNPAVECRS